MALLTRKQTTMENKEITNLVLVPEKFESLEVLEEVLKTMKVHEGFKYMNRSDGVLSPQGPTGYKDIIEIHWKSMALMMDWSEKMQHQMPKESMEQLSGVQILFYEYKP